MARDQAGNEQYIETAFLLKQDQPLMDTDPDTPRPVGKPPSNGLTPKAGSNLGNVQYIEGLSAGGSPANATGITGNPLYNPTYWQNVSGSPWPTIPPGYDKNGTPGYPDPELTYVQRISKILETADDVMAEGVKRAALRNRRGVLMELAQQVDAGQFYGEMEPSLYGIFKIASVITKTSEAKRVGGYLAGQIVDPNDPAVRVQTFQAETLTAIEQEVKRREMALNSTQQEELGKAALGLAYSYSQLDPRADSDRTQKDFLGKLWRAQGQPDSSLVDLAGTDLRDLLQDVPDDRLVTTISFLGNLLKAANGVQDLNQEGDLRDPVFLRELVKFGVEYAKLNPDTSLSQVPQGWLDELWRAGSTPGAARNRAVKKGAMGLAQLFKDISTKDKRTEMLSFESKLLKTLRSMPDSQLHERLRSPVFTSWMIDWGSKYISSNEVENHGLVVNNFYNLFSDVAKSEYEQIGLVASADLGAILFNIPGLIVIPDADLAQVLRYAYIEPLVSTLDKILTNVLSPSEILEIKTSARNTIPYILRSCFLYGVVNTSAAAYILATAEHETNYWRFLEEQAPAGKDAVAYFSDKYKNYNGNGGVDTKDGYIFRGQGLVHLTYRFNYRKFTVNVVSGSSSIISKNLETYTEEEYRKGNTKAAQNIGVAADVLVLGMEQGYFTKDVSNPGRGVEYLDKYFQKGKEASQSDFFEARNIVNGGDKNDIPEEQNETIGAKIARRAGDYLQKIKSWPIRG